MPRRGGPANYEAKEREMSRMGREATVRCHRCNDGLERRRPRNVRVANSTEPDMACAMTTENKSKTGSFEPATGFEKRTVTGKANAKCDAVKHPNVHFNTRRKTRTRVAANRRRTNFEQDNRGRPVP